MPIWQQTVVSIKPYVKQIMFFKALPDDLFKKKMEFKNIIKHLRAKHKFN